MNLVPTPDHVTVIDNPADPRVQAIFLRAHVRLRIIGMTHSKLSPTRLRQLCAANTGKPYTSRTDWAVILRDLIAIINS